MGTLPIEQARSTEPPLIWWQLGCKLPDPRGPLSRLVPSSSIVSANEKVQSVLDSKDRTQSGRKGQRYAKLSPELQEGRNRQAGSRARCYSQVVRDCFFFFL